MRFENESGQTAQLVANTGWHPVGSRRVLSQKDAAEVMLQDLPDAFNSEELERI